METNLVSLCLFVAFLPLVCFCKSLDGSDLSKTKNHFQNHKVASPGKVAGFQSWNDWVAKRNFDSNEIFGDKGFQGWKDWMKKRGFMTPMSRAEFGSEYGKSPSFQQWNDWRNKRSFGPNQQSSFSNNAPVAQGRFQAWNDWMSKRALGVPAHMAGGSKMFAPPTQNDFQSWVDFTKKANFGTDPDFLGMGNMQPWHMYKKRFLNDPSSYPFSSQFDSKQHLMKWDDVFKRSAGKLQLGNDPGEFGRYREYFTKGLQDWRNTFESTKRNEEQIKQTKEE